MKRLFLPGGVFLLLCLMEACKAPIAGVFGKRTPHEVYTDKISAAGLDQTVMGRSWLDAASRSLAAPAVITTPYSERGYFAAERPGAVGLRFPGKMGEKLLISLETVPATGFTVYMDLWRVEGSNNELKLLAAADTAARALEYEVEGDESLLLRLQPALLESGEYTLSIRTGPSLAYPIRAPGNNHIRSFWGAARDAGARRHEGIDLFAKFRTPVVAAADGVVTSVSESNLGGKTVWMRPEDKSYVLYYAHLDEQLVREGQRVKTGDTLGLMGNTGNARTTPPHLHFGIYGRGGAVDPLAFVNPVVKEPPVIKAKGSLPGEHVRVQLPSAKIYSAPVTDTTAVSVPRHTPLRVEAAMGNWLRVVLPDAQSGYISTTAVASLDKPLRDRRLNTAATVHEAPDTLAARKTTLPADETVAVLAQYNEYLFVQYNGGDKGWMIR
ncbi:M23 family metallopeptidase [Chitinophaga cymbidii]|nr:M23 family metallopeptidase [Chitinophaga cymbidii]